MIEIFPDRCQPLRYPKAQCRLCINACPLECIELQYGSIEVKEDLCTGCGVCTNICPSGALTLKYLSERSLIEILSEFTENEEVLFLSCQLGRGGKKERKGLPVIILPCLSILKEAHLVGIVCSGVKEVYLDIGSCDGCFYDSGRERIYKTVSYAKNFLIAFGVNENRIILSDGTPINVNLQKKQKLREIHPGQTYSRREVFSSFGKGMMKVIEPHSNKNNEVKVKRKLRQLISEISEKRRVLLEILRGLSKPTTEILKETNLPTLSLSIGEECTLCYHCDLFCPTGAIRREEDEETVRIEFTSAYCTNCYECENLCPEKAIGVVKSLDLSPFIFEYTKTLKQKEIARCLICKKGFIPKKEEDICLSCSRKRDIDRNFLDMMGLT